MIIKQQYQIGWDALETWMSNQPNAIQCHRNRISIAPNPSKEDENEFDYNEDWSWDENDRMDCISSSMVDFLNSEIQGVWAYRNYSHYSEILFSNSEDMTLFMVKFK